MASFPQNSDLQNQALRQIKTARTLEEINDAAKKGFWPLVRKVEPSKEIRTKFKLIQHKQTGELKLLGDFREDISEDYGWIFGEENGGESRSDYETVIDWTFYYPHCFPSPFAAYLIPDDIHIGETVFIQDLIEDHVESKWNQGDSVRMKSCRAVWNGKDFDIQFDDKKDQINYIG